MIYFRCNSGHFFSGELCPWDGWSHPEVWKVLELSRRFATEGTAVSILNLRAAGVKEDAIKRIVIVEFGDPDAVIEGIYPKQVVVKGRVSNPIDLDSRFK
jgi:hypothetical protein